MSNGQALVPYGFTALESEIYVFLLDHSPATGYRIAQGINKPAANTYKAIQGLQSKGAILVEEGANRMCRAVGLEELMNRLRKDFELRQKSTVKDLSKAGKPPEDERIYSLKSREQILNRIREMVLGANSLVLIKLSSDGLHAVEGTLDQAAERGISISVLTDEPMEIEGVDVACATDSLRTFCAVADGRQIVAGSVGTDGAIEAMWTQNGALAQVHLESLSAEIALAHVSALLAADEKRSRIQKAVDSRKSQIQNRQE